MYRSILNALASIRPKLARGAVACSLAVFPMSHVADVLHAQRVIAAAAPHRAELRYSVQFEGVGAEGIDDIWRGRIGGSSPGEIMLRVEYLGKPEDAARPVWPVRVMMFVAADDPAKSFLAETGGTIDWRSGDVRLSGHVSVGWMKGANVAQMLRLDRKELDGTGTLQLEMTTASR